MPVTVSKKQYESKKENARQRERLLTAAGQDIAPCPAPTDLAVRVLCDGSYKYFCEEVFPEAFPLAWSPDHLKIIKAIERAVIFGESIAIAMPRGSGKTTLCEVAVIWAIVTGRHRFVFLIGSADELAGDSLEKIKVHLSTNKRLLELYPEAVYPIHMLEGETRRCGGQRYYGHLTRISFGDNQIIMPTLPGSRCSGGIIRVAGITGAIRGAAVVLEDGKVIRPSLALIDDPQTDASAKSLTQTKERLSIIEGAIKGLAGPGKKVARLMPCTVIKAGDLADQLLDRKKNPVWMGERTKMLYEFPAKMELWEKYQKIKTDALEIGGTAATATQFYIENRIAMDAGAKVGWEARFNQDEISAVQNAMNLFYENSARFFSEYQNDPQAENLGEDEGLLSADQIADKLNGMKRAEIPVNCNRMTMFIDVQGKLLYWTVCAWADDFTGYVIDYGAYPDQRREYFTLRESQRTIQTVLEGAGLEAAIYGALETLTKLKLATRYRRDDGAEMQIGQTLIDANWGVSTEIVYQFCRQSEHAVTILPSHGRFVGAGSKPFNEYKKYPGDRAGLNWRVPNVQGKREVRHVTFDTNYWKSFIHSRLAVKIGDGGCLSLYGRDPDKHRMIADHLTAEYRVKTEGRGRVVDEWKVKPSAPDNHWLDCLVGCAVGASLLGVSIPGTERKNIVKPRVSFSDMQKARRSAAK